MSLYADEDLNTLQNLDTAAIQVDGPHNPLEALRVALTSPAESSTQAEALVLAGKRFEEQPEKLPELCEQLLPMFVDGGESLLRSWTLEMVALAVGRSGLKVEVKLSVAQASLEALNRLLAGESIATIKAVIPIFSTIYPIIFKLLATSRPSGQIYDLFMASKARILSFILDPNARPQNAGLKAISWKFAQRVLLIGTRAAAADPRLQNKGVNATDPSINMITSDSPLSVQQLEEEANNLRTQLITQLYSLDDPAVLHAIINILPPLAKSRPALAPLIVSSITSWTPSALENAGRPAMQIRAVDKTARAAMMHLARYPALSAYSAQFKDAITRQRTRLEEAFTMEQAARAARRAGIPLGVLGKHPGEFQAESSADGAKRAKLEMEASSGSLGTSQLPRLPPFDVSSLPVQTVIDLVIATMQNISDQALTEAIENARRAIGEGRPDAEPLLAGPLGALGSVKAEGGDLGDDDEVLNPLDMEMEDEDDLLLALHEDEDTDEGLTFLDFKLPPPESLPVNERTALVETALKRIWTSGGDLASLPDAPDSDGVKSAIQPKELWMLLLARLSTRGGDVKRTTICEFIAADFASRSKFASIWLNEQWYNEKIGGVAHYGTNLDAILAAFVPKIDAKDKSLAPFLSSLPELPSTVIAVLESLCLDPERSIVGFLALRDLIINRPPIRQSALRVLLELCTHNDLKIRVMAISTIKRWVPDSPMSAQIVSYALGVVRRLIQISELDEKKPSMEEEDGDVKMEFVLREEPVQSRYLADVNSDTVRQHVDLFFSLARRQQSLLNDIFVLYTKMDQGMQDTIESLLTPLIQSLGPTESLLDVVRKFPEGSDKLALRVVTILSAEGSSPVLLLLVKSLMAERELDPGFIIPIIGQLEKAEIEKQIPRIVSLLGTSDDSRDLVRTAFASVLQKMTPADLLVTLHNEDTALKPTIEAIGICFSMTTVFRSDVLANSMQRIADLPTLPVVFLRTIIQAVSTYKSLIPFIANNVLPKLVAKKIWTNPQLWDGFVRLARRIAPASFGALMQLPKEWLKDLVEKQPALKPGLKGFLAGKQGTREVMAEIFGDEA